jgi:DNA processing protein
MTPHAVPSLEELSDLFTLEAVKGFGPQKFKELHESGVSPSQVLARPAEMQRFGKRGLDFRRQLDAMAPLDREKSRQRAKKQIEAARVNEGAILTYDNPNYPSILYASNLPVAALYARGNLAALRKPKAVACVGSRKIRPPYTELHDTFARRAIASGFVIVSGFATGADIIGHLAAEAANGFTIGVMPSGLDRPFPPEHKEIWHRFLQSDGAVFVSEFGFGVGANALNLRKRNKMIAGMALGVLISQSTEDGGAMNAYRFGIEQKKPVATFKNDGKPDTSGNELIAGSAERANSTVLPLNGGLEWSAWLQTL